jgi:hypothetical protein
MKLPLRIFIVTVVDVAVTDSVVYYHLKQHPGSFTLLLLIEMILVTILPIALTLLFWQYQQSKKHNK